MIVNNVDKSEKNKAKFQVEVDPAAFEETVNKAYQKKKSGIYIAGFRKGKAPRAIIEGMYGPDVFYQDAIDALGPDAFGFGVKDAELDFVGAPALVDVKFDDDKNLVFTFSVDLYPEVELGQYKELELEKEVPEISEEQLQEALENVKKRNARMVPAERAAQMGDTANIDFDGFLDGERFEGGKAEGYSLELGSNAFVPGFEEQVAGMNIGEEKDVEVTFPENYAEQLAGKKAVFKVKLNGLTVAEYPELDDDFAKDVSEFDTMDEYKADLKQKMLDSAASEASNRYRSNLLQLAADNMTADIPDIMIEDKVNELIRNYASNFGVKANDIPRDKLLEMLGIDSDSMNLTIRPAAVHQVRVDLMLEAVVKAENIEISDEEGDEYIAKLAGDYKAKPEDLINYFGRDFMINEYKKEKAANTIVDTAKDVKGRKMPEPETKETEEEHAEDSETEEKAAKKPARKPAAKKAAKKEETEAE